MAPRPSPPAAERVGDEVTRLLSTHVLTAVVAILGFESRDSVPMSELKTSYLQIATQVHPLLGGLRCAERAPEALGILTRAFALAQHASAYDAFCAGEQTKRLGAGSSAFAVPATLLWCECETDTEKEMREAQGLPSLDAASTGGADDDFDDAGDQGDQGDQGDGAEEEEEKEEEEEGDVGSLDVAGLEALYSKPVMPQTAEPTAALRAPERRVRLFAPSDISLEAVQWRLLTAQEARVATLAKARIKKKEKAKTYLANAVLEALQWRPKAHAAVPFVVGMCVPERYMAAALCRAEAAHTGVRRGIKLRQDLYTVEASCRRDGCSFARGFGIQMKDGSWKLTKMREHDPVLCFGQEMPVVEAVVEAVEAVAGAKKKPAVPPVTCVAAYPPAHVARALRHDFADDPNINATAIGKLLKAMALYRFEPPQAHCRAIGRNLRDEMRATRDVSMAAMPGFAALLEAKGHTVKLLTVTGKEMLAIRRKSSKFIFLQQQKDGHIPKDAVFNPADVRTDDIDEGGTYYGGVMFRPSVAGALAERGRKTACADASHCEGIGEQSFGTLFEIDHYDTGNFLVPAVVGHYIGTEDLISWQAAFDILHPSFDCPDRVVMVDNEKSIDHALRKMQFAKPFADERHIHKNMSKAIGGEKGTGLKLYSSALRAPSQARVDYITARYGPKQTDYLSKFDKRELYRSCAADGRGLQDLVLTSQGAETSMAAALKSGIRATEPHRLLEKIVTEARGRFLKAKTAAETWEGPVPPRVQEVLAKKIAKAEEMYKTVTWIRDTDNNEALVQSYTEAGHMRRVVLSSEPHVAPSCCAYSTDGSGFPCLHAIKVIVNKYGPGNVWRFVHRRHLTETWRRQYLGVEFEMPAQADVDAVMDNAKKLVAAKQNLMIPKAIPPPRGRPPKNAGKRLKQWYERGPGAKKKRVYTCSLCRGEGHTREDCFLRQIFDDRDDSNVAGVE